MTQFFIALFIFICWLIYNHFTKPKVDYAAKLEEANRRYGAMEENYKAVVKVLEESRSANQQLQERFGKLQHQKISADVKMGQKSENLAPFLDEFPYPAECVRGLFNPIDLIAFTDDEVVFVEVKSGAAQLSEKQRRIRDNIKAGRVRFEVVRMNEKGVTIK